MSRSKVWLCSMCRPAQLKTLTIGVFGTRACDICGTVIGQQQQRLVMGAASMGFINGDWVAVRDFQAFVLAGADEACSFNGEAPPGREALQALAERWEHSSADPGDEFGAGEELAHHEDAIELRALLDPPPRPKGGGES